MQFLRVLSPLSPLAVKNCKKVTQQQQQNKIKHSSEETLFCVPSCSTQRDYEIPSLSCRSYCLLDSNHKPEP